MNASQESPPRPESTSSPWWREMDRYHWFVLVIAALGWLFDTMDQQLFALARAPAMAELHAAPDSEELSVTKSTITRLGGYATSVFMIGWAVGGIGFGILGDRIGRVRTMALTILTYSLFTGLSALSVGIYDFSFYRFLTGLGVGGEFAVGVSLVAEVMPERARAHALGWLQASSALGNMAAAGIGILLGHLERIGIIENAWRAMFLLGILPALLVVLIMMRLKEPERWQKTAVLTADRKQLGSLRDLFGTARWRHNAIVGMTLAFAGVVGLWAIGFFSYDLIRTVLAEPMRNEYVLRGDGDEDREFARLLILRPAFLDEAAKRTRPVDLLDREATSFFKAALALRKEDSAVTPNAVLKVLGRASQTDEARTRQQTFLKGAPRDLAAAADGGAELISDHLSRITQRTKEIDGDLTLWAGITSLLFNFGAFFGVNAFRKYTHRAGRKPAFAVGFTIALVSTAFTFWFLKDKSDVFWMIPIMGFCQLTVFGGYAIYFPELFPTRLRSTGTSFCYNVGRVVAAAGPSSLGLLTSEVFGAFQEPMRYAGVTMCACFLIGLIALPFAPETRGQPLPE